MKEKKLLTTPNITTRGFILVNENEELIKKIEKVSTDTILESFKDPKINFVNLKSNLTETIYPYIYKLTGRKPIIIPVITDIKSK